MSQFVKSFTLNRLAGADLSAKQFFIIKISTTNDKQVVLAAAGTDPIIGVLENKPASGKAAAIQIGGTAKVIAGGTVTAGDLITSDSAGKGITTVTDKNTILGRALESAVVNDIFEVLLSPGAPPISQ